MRTARTQGTRLVVAFAEVGDRTAAEALRGGSLVVDVDPAERPDDPDEFYDHQLVGLVARAGDRLLGTVREVQHLPHQDLLVIDADDRSEPVLVPLVTALVPEIDLAGGVVHVADRPGLLDDPGAGPEREG